MRLTMLIILLLTGCASSSIDLAEMKSLPHDQGVIFGRVRLIEGGKEKTLMSWHGLSRLRLMIISDTSSEAIFVPLKDSGVFIWRLPAGSYTIAHFRWWRYMGPSAHRHGRIFADFRVFENKATYIGKLTISFTDSSYTVSVEDEYESSLSAFKNQLPDMEEEPIRCLMQLEERR